jgi:hypothetical protein
MHKIGHQLYWLPARLLNVRQLVQEGFNWIDCAAGWGEPNANWNGAECSSFHSYCQLLPVGVNQWFPKATADYFPTPMYQDGWVQSAPESFFTQINNLTFDKSGLAAWYRQVFSEFKVGTSSDLQQALFEPHLLMRLGFQLARSAAEKQGVTSLAFQAAMSAVGVGCRGIDIWVCDHCYRRSRGELRICDLHSQAKIVLDLAGAERVAQISRSRATRKAAQAMDPKAIPKRKFNGYWELELCEFEMQVGGILWQLTGAAHQDWLDQVLQALSSAPLVGSRLTESFTSEPNHLQIEQLQRAVGSREWLVSRWPTLIPLAETWLLAEKSAAPGSIAPGLTERNRQRVVVANSLLAANFTHSQIAEQLQISRSHLSQLLRRAARKPAM